MNAKTKLWVDIGLFAVFLIEFFLELTGLALHQVIGVTVGVMAVYHLALHWSWVKAVTARFFGKTSDQARLYYLIDTVLVIGLAGIIGTGLVISSWFSLPPTNYGAWRTVHIGFSTATLVVAVLKIGLHWRWIALQLRVFFSRPRPQLDLAAVPQPAQSGRLVTRREMLKIMGVVGIASVLALSQSLQSLAQSSGASDDGAVSNQVNATDDQRNPNAAAAAFSTTVSPTAQSCTVLCSKHCAFPGRCRRYVDTNGNNLCDRGECL